MKQMSRILAASVLAPVLLVLATGCLQTIYPKKKVAVSRPSSQPSRPEKQPGQKPGQPGTPQAVRPTGPPPEEILNKAEKAYLESDYDQAARQYELYLTGYGDYPQADRALIGLGQAREALGDREKAAEAYARLVKDRPQSPFFLEAGRRLVALYLEMGYFRKAADLAPELINRSDDSTDKAGLRLMLGKAQLGRGAPVQALELFRKALTAAEDPVDRDEARRGMRAAVEAMSPEELTMVQTELGGDAPGPYVSYLLAYRLYQAGSLKEARSQARWYLDHFPQHEMAGDARALLAAVNGEGPLPPLVTVSGFLPPPAADRPGGEDGTGEAEGPLPEYKSMNIACVLPLSGGRAAKYGRRVLEGLQMAFRYYESVTPGFSADLAPLDSRSDPAEAVRQVEAAASRPDILAVVGPLLSACAAEAAPKAEELEIPLLAVSQKGGLPGVGPYIFRLFLTPKIQARAVARYAVQIQGMNRLAALYPEDVYGRTMSEYFSAEVEALGGRVVSTDGYDPQAKDYSENIQRLAGVGKARRRVRAGRKVEVGFDAVFVPDSIRAVAMIAPQFAFHDITTIRLLGTSLWHSEKLLEAAARYTQKCIIPTAFFAGREDPATRKFVEMYRLEKGDDEAVPGQFEAYGYDAGRLLLTMMDKKRVSTREGLQQALVQGEPFPGVTGRFMFDEDGECRGETILVTVEGDEFRLVQQQTPSTP